MSDESSPRNGGKDQAPTVTREVKLLEWKLSCRVDGLTYDFNTQIGHLHMAPDHCCDMEGCIALFKRIDAEVKRIETFAGTKPDTIYIRRREDDAARPGMGWYAVLNGHVWR